ncbi:MAG: HAD-IA family hydrolase [Clostridia bacterium]|nr:HAD-IA family hydrolase [Clostridia bacterium]
MKKAIIFDLDGTLWNTTKECTLVWSKVAKNYNLKVNRKQIKEIMGLTKEEIIKYFFEDNSELGNKFITECQNKENEYLKQYGGTIYQNTIKTIKELSKNYELFIVSNCQSGYIEAFLNYYDLGHYFKDYECYGNTGKSKEYNINILMERNNIKNVVYVGDTEKDYLASTCNNIRFIWAKYGFGMCNYCNDYVNDIFELLRKL